MNALDQAEAILAKLTPGERARLLQRLVQELGESFPGIDSIPDVAGGEPIIVRTRIPVWLLVRARQRGTSERELLRAYPTLRAEDVANEWAYYRSHRNEIETQIVAHEEA